MERSRVIRWHAIPFRHSCGTLGTILGVCGSQDGCIAISGLCLFCGKEFSIEAQMNNIVVECVHLDDKANHDEPSPTPDEMLANFRPHGKEN